MLRRIAPPLISTVAIALLACWDNAEPPTASEILPGSSASALAPFRFRQVSVGEGHTCGVTTDNVAYCWGSGPLGNGTVGASTVPVAVAGNLTFRQVSAGGRFHSCGVTTDDIAYCWGTNSFGQLGNGTEFDSDVPIPVSGGHLFQEVNVGILHTCGLTKAGVAYCWGHNDQGELGNGDFNASLNPVPVAGEFVFRQLTTGSSFTCGVTTGNVAYCWGSNIEGQLGIGNDTGPQTCFSAEFLHGCANRPVRVARGLAFSRLSAGFRHVCGVATNGSGYCWGSREAVGREDVTGLRPVQVSGRLTFFSVSAGSYYSCGVTTDHVAYCWGSTGALGIGGMRERACADRVCSRPQRVDTDLSFLDVQAGPGHTCGVTNNNLAYCWGGNGSGQLGDGTTHPRLRPRRVASPG